MTQIIWKRRPVFGRFLLYTAIAWIFIIGIVFFKKAFSTTEDNTLESFDDQFSEFLIDSRKDALNQGANHENNEIGGHKDVASEDSLFSKANKKKENESRC